MADRKDDVLSIFDNSERSGSILDDDFDGPRLDIYTTQPSLIVTRAKANETNFATCNIVSEVSDKLPVQPSRSYHGNHVNNKAKGRSTPYTGKGKAPQKKKNAVTANKGANTFINNINVNLLRKPAWVK